MKWRIYRESNGETDIKKLLKMNGVGKLPSGFTFKLAERTTNESYGNDDWDSDKPLVYKYHSDEPISVEEFVDKVRSEEQNIEDIFIQNSDYYENADEPLKEFLEDMCQGQTPEDVFDLEYYMNQAAKEQLPKDIAKCVRLTGFDAMDWLCGIFERLMPICKDPR